MSTSRLLIGGAVLSLLVGGMAAFKRPEADPVSAQSLRPSPNPLASPQIAVFPTTQPSASVRPTVPIYSGYQPHRITTCAGQESNANFRWFPSLDPRSVLGVVAYGDLVGLTGRTMEGDGVIWYEAIAPTLYPSHNPSVQNHLRDGQIGWIASCFVRE